MDGHGDWPRRSRCRRFGRIDHAILACGKSNVASRRHRQRQNALADGFQIHLHFYLFRALVFVFVLIVLLGVVFFRVVLLGVLRVVLLRFVFLGVWLLLLVALRRQRRGLGLREHHYVHAGRHRPGETLDVRLHRRARVGAGGEVQVFAVLVEDRAFGVAHAVGHLRGLAVRQRVEINRPHMALQRFRVRQPLAVRRPRGGQSIAVGVVIRLHQHRFLLLQVDIEEMAVVVQVRDLLAVRRPIGRGIERLIAERDLLHFARTILVAHVQRVIARFVGKVRDALAIGRPAWLPLHHRRALGQVARVALFGRNGDDLAPRFEDCPRTVGRYVGIGEPLGDVDVVRPHLRQIAGQGDRDLLGPPALQVIQMQRAELFIHDGARSRRSRFEIEALVFDGAGDFLRFDVIKEQRHRPFAVGEEIDPVAHHIGLKSFEFSRGIGTTLESAISAIQILRVWPPRYRFQASCHWNSGT